jgi:hypothetical protein
MVRFVVFMFVVLLVFCLLQTAGISQWMECSSSNVGQVVEINGNEYICSDVDGGFNWESKSMQDTILMSLPTILAIAAFVFVVAFIFLGRKKVAKHFKKNKKRLF